MKKVYLFIAICILLVSLVSAEEYSLDINIGKSTYSSGEKVTYKVILLKDGVPFEDTLKVFASDVSNKKTLDFDVTSNKENSFNIENDFASGYWEIETSYNDKNVKRFFTIGEREEAEFSIDGDTLIIKNTGNVPYTKNVQILIGDVARSQKQYIEIGDYKEIKLVAPDGDYYIRVTDGVTSVEKSDIHLTSSGTGNVIGALDENILGSQSALGGVREDPNSYSSSNNYIVAFLFIFAVFGLFILLMIERVLQKKRAHAAKGMLKLH
jgi:hypothetical protein